MQHAALKREHDVIAALDLPDTVRFTAMAWSNIASSNESNPNSLRAWTYLIVTHQPAIATT